jgi:hypothetical protein
MWLHEAARKHGGRCVQVARDESIGVAAKCMGESATRCLVITVACAVKGIIIDSVR